MTGFTPPEATPEQVADIATMQVDLPRFALLGIFGNVDAPAALIRESANTITRVTTGDTIAGQTVAAIAEDHLILARGTRTKVLRMPET